MKILTCPQGSKEWLDQRKKHVTGTDAAKILGLSPWGSAHDVFLDKIGEAPPFFINPAMKYGTEMEPIIRENYESLRDEWFPSAVITNDAGWALSSLDGISSCMTSILEIKTCNAKVFVDSLKGKIPDYYMSQAQFAMMCAETALAVEFVFFHKEEYAYVTVKRDDDYIEEMKEKCFEFYNQSIVNSHGAKVV